MDYPEWRGINLLRMCSCVPWQCNVNSAEAPTSPCVLYAVLWLQIRNTTGFICGDIMCESLCYVMQFLGELDCKTKTDIYRKPQKETDYPSHQTSGQWEALWLNRLKHITCTTTKQAGKVLLLFFPKLNMPNKQQTCCQGKTEFLINRPLWNKEIPVRNTLCDLKIWKE